MELRRAAKTVMCEGCGEPIRRGEIIVVTHSREMSGANEPYGYWDCVYCAELAQGISRAWLAAYMAQYEAIRAPR